MQGEFNCLRFVLLCEVCGHALDMLRDIAYDAVELQHIVIRSG